MMTDGDDIDDAVIDQLLGKLKSEFLDVEGKNIVITGSLQDYGFTRDALETIIEVQGGCLQKSVTKTTDYLVYGEKPGNTKFRDAVLKGVTIVKADEFMSMLRRM